MNYDSQELFFLNCKWPYILLKITVHHGVTKSILNIKGFISKPGIQSWPSRLKYLMKNHIIKVFLTWGLTSVLSHQRQESYPLSHHDHSRCSGQSYLWIGTVNFFLRHETVIFTENYSNSRPKKNKKKTLLNWKDTNIYCFCP